MNMLNLFIETPMKKQGQAKQAVDTLPPPIAPIG
jgi:hypothetical protein